MVWMLYAVLILIISGLNLTITGDSNFIGSLFNTDGLVFFIILLLLFPILSFIFFGIIHLFLKIFGGKGTFSNTLKFSLSLGVFPLIFLYILFIVFVLFLGIGGFAVLFLFFSLLIIIVWSLVISIRVYSTIHQISILRAFFAMFLSFVIFLILSTLFYGFLIDSLTKAYNNRLREDLEEVSTQKIKLYGSNLYIELIKSDSLYLRNRGMEPEIVSRIEITPSNCQINKKFEIQPGISSVDLNCSDLIKGKNYDVLIISNNGVQSQSLIVR